MNTTNFDIISESARTLGQFLQTLPVLEAPWDTAFQKQYCSSCHSETCSDNRCPYPEYRNNPTWWLSLDAGNSILDHREDGISSAFSGKHFS